MVDDNSGSGGGPDIFEAAKGAAHLYDLFSQKQHDEDPRMRHKFDQLDTVSVADALHAVNNVVVSDDTVKADPILDLRDTKNGIQVLLDIGSTQVDHGDVEIEEVDRGVMVKANGWETAVDIEDQYELVDWVRENKPGMVVVDIELRSKLDPPEPEPDQEPEAEEDSSGDEEEVADDDTEDDSEGVEIQTLAQFMENNQDIEEALREEYGDSKVDFAIRAFGDRPLDEAATKIDMLNL